MSKPSAQDFVCSARNIQKRGRGNWGRRLAPKARWSAELKARAREARAAGASVTVLARDFAVPYPTIYAWVRDVEVNTN